MRTKTILSIMLMSVLVGSSFGSIKPAYADDFFIDAFDDGNVDETVNTGNPQEVTNEDGLGSKVIGGDRDAILDHISGNTNTRLRISEATSQTTMSYSADVGNKGKVTLTYDVSGGELNSDFSDTAAIAFAYKSSDGGTDVKVTLTSDDDNTGAGTATVSKTRTSIASNVPYSLSFPMTDFPGLELDDIDKIVIEFTPQFEMVDFTLESITAKMIQVVGGTGDSASPVALLIGAIGASGMMMILPAVVVAGTGIGVFAAKRNSNKTLTKS